MELPKVTKTTGCGGLAFSVLQYIYIYIYIYIHIYIHSTSSAALRAALFHSTLKQYLKQDLWAAHKFPGHVIS